jgi:hypothetical protein
VVLTSTNATYTPASGFSGEDRFTYTLSDGHGATTNGTVVVTVAAVGGGNAVSITVTPGNVHLEFAGIAGRVYTIERATDVQGPWTPLTPTVTAAGNGAIAFDDTAPPVGVAFYRISTPLNP